MISSKRGVQKVFRIPARDVLKMEQKNIIADDMKITVNFNRITPDGTCIDKKGTVAHYIKKEMFQARTE